MPVSHWLTHSVSTILPLSSWHMNCDFIWYWKIENSNKMYTRKVKQIRHMIPRTKQPLWKALRLARNAINKSCKSKEDYFPPFLRRIPTNTTSHHSIMRSLTSWHVFILAPGSPLNVFLSKHYFSCSSAGKGCCPTTTGTCGWIDRLLERLLKTCILIDSSLHCLFRPI